MTTTDSAWLHRHWRQAAGILGKRGGRFARIRRGSKLPTRKGWNRTENTLARDQALVALDAGDNVTLACGTGNLYAFDFDRDADRGYECDHLGFYIHRANAPHKAKFVFQCPDPIPTRLDKQHGVDLLGVNGNGTHWSCVFAGVHSSGAPLLWGGTSIPVLPLETVAALWLEWTGRELFAPGRAEMTPDPTYATADVARVADALKYVDANAIDYNIWQGIIAALHDALGDEAKALAVDWADGKPGEVEAKWNTYDRDYGGRPATLATIFYLARQHGWPDSWLSSRLAAYGEWLASPAAIIALKEAGFKNPERARKLLDAILEKCADQQRLRVAPGSAYLAKATGIGAGSLNGKDGLLVLLNKRGFIRLSPDVRQVVSESRLVDVETGEVQYTEVEHTEYGPLGIELVFHNLITSTIGSIPIDPSGRGGDQVVKNWNVYREFRGDELFLNNHHVYIVTHTKANLPPLGDNGLPTLLALLDGEKTTQEIADSTGHSYQAVARVMRRYVEHGLVDVTTGYRNRKSYTLKAEWRESLQANRIRTPTYGIQIFRRVVALRSRLHYLRVNGQAEQAERLEPHYQRMVVLENKIKAEAGIVAYQRPKPARRRLKHAMQAEQPEDRLRRQALAHEVAKQQRESYRHIRRAIAELIRDKIPRRQWFGNLSHLGFTPGEIKRAMTIRIQEAAA